MLCLIAGTCFFLFISNRALIDIHEGLHKIAVFVLAFLVTIPGFGLWGLLANSALPLHLALFIMGAAALMEGVRLFIRHKHRGSPPIEKINESLSLARPFTTTHLVLARYAIECPDWTGPDFRIAHLSDLHMTTKLPEDYYRQVIEHIDETKPDLVFLTGDFAHNRKSFPLLKEMLPEIRARIGTYAVLGNHDYWTGAVEVAEILEQCGVNVLRNHWRRVTVDNQSAITLSGCETPWNTDPWNEPPRTPNQPLFVLSHTSDHIYHFNQSGAFAVFAGHFHAGQFKIPGLGSFVIPSAHGRRYDHGHFMVEGTHLFVTAGIGAGSPPIRIYCQPDLFVVDVKGNQDFIVPPSL